MPTALSSRTEAERVARLIGCSGAHEVPDGWMPCESAVNLRVLTRYGVRAYRKRAGKVRRVSNIPEAGPHRSGRSAESINAGLGKGIQCRDGVHGDRTPGGRNLNVPWGKPAGWGGRKRRRVRIDD